MTARELHVFPYCPIDIFFIFLRDKNTSRTIIVVLYHNLFNLNHLFKHIKNI